MNVSLKQVVGKKRDRQTGEVVEVRYALDFVYVDEEMVGQISRRTGAAFCPLPHVHELRAQDIIKQIDAIRKKEGVYGPCEPIASMAPSEPIEELIDLDDDREEEEDI